MDLIGIFYINLDVGFEIGKMFYFIVFVENKDGFSKLLWLFYIWLCNDNYLYLKLFIWIILCGYIFGKK